MIEEKTVIWGNEARTWGPSGFNKLEAIDQLSRYLVKFPG